MNLKELAFPIRIYWDLASEHHNSVIDCKGISKEIVELKFFTLNLLDTGVPLSYSCMEILETLKSEMISVTLTLPPSALDSSTIARLSELNVKEILVNASVISDVEKTAEKVRQYKNSGITIGVSYQMTKDIYGAIPEVVSFCLNNHISRLVFPMQRLTEKEDCFYIAREEGKELTDQLKEIDISTMKITIHDPFLWKIFYPEAAFPGGGCQAGNSMVYIAPDGSVYPCPSMPEKLGDLKETTLKIILTADSKKELVKSIRKAPE